MWTLDDEDKIKALESLGMIGGEMPPAQMTQQAPPNTPTESPYLQLSKMLGADVDFEKPLQDARTSRKALDEDFERRLAESRRNELNQSTISNAINAFGNLGQSRTDALNIWRSGFQDAKGNKLAPIASAKFDAGYAGPALAKQATQDLATSYGMKNKRLEADTDDALKSLSYRQMGINNKQGALNKVIDRDEEAKRSIAKMAQDRELSLIASGMKKEQAEQDAKRYEADLVFKYTQLKETSRHNNAMENRPAAQFISPSLAFQMGESVNRDVKDLSKANKDEATQAISAIDAAIGLIGKNKDSIPGVSGYNSGFLGNIKDKLPDWAPGSFDTNEKTNRAVIQTAQNLITKYISGGAVSDAEGVRLNKASAMIGDANPAVVREGLVLFKSTLLDVMARHEAGYRPEVIETFKKQGGKTSDMYRNDSKQPPVVDHAKAAAEELARRGIK